MIVPEEKEFPESKSLDPGNPKMPEKKNTQKAKKKGSKRNAGARRKERESPPVELSSRGQFDFDALAERIAERRALIQAIPNYAKFQ